MPEHTSGATTHLTLLASVTQKLVKENQELQQTTAELRQKQQLTDVQIQVLKRDACQMKVDVMKLSGFPLDFHVKFSNDRVCSLAFYSHPHGINFALRWFHMELRMQTAGTCQYSRM